MTGESASTFRVSRGMGATLLTAAAVTCAQPPVGLWWVGGLALTPWLVASRGAAGLIAGGAVWGLLSGIAMGSWVHGGLRNLGASPLEAATGLVVTAVVVTGLPGALYGVAAMLARRAPAGASLVFALLVAGIDALRGIPHVGLPWALLGHTQAPAAGVAQLAVALGVPGLSALLAGLSYSLAEAFSRDAGTGRASRCTSSWPPWLGAYLALLLLGLPVARALAPPAEAETRRLLAIQHRISPRERWLYSAQERNVERLGRRTLEAARAQTVPPDLVLWPETSVTVALEEAPPVAASLRGWLARIGAPLVLGGVSSAGSDSRYHNSALWLDASGALRDRFDKTLAVPLVERAPTGRVTAALRRAFGATSVHRLVVEGDEQRSLRGDDAYAVVLCFEVLYPGLVAARLEPDALAILNLANDSWFGSAVPGAQQLAFARFRAIEQRRPLLRVADAGPSALVDRFGRIAQALDPEASGALAVTIEASAGPTRVEQAAILSLALLGSAVGPTASGGSRPSRARASTTHSRSTRSAT